MNEFDRHPSIEYRDTLAQWWGAYCIRVMVKLPELDPLMRLMMCHSDFMAYRDKIAQRIVPPAEGHYFWRTGTATGLNYFFDDPTEAAEFIDANVKNIVAVDRPADFNRVDAIRACQTEDESLASIKAIVRENLFFKKYRYCIKLERDRYRKEEINTEINDMMVRMFGYDPVLTWPEDALRIKYKYPNGKNVYLRDFNDVILIKMCLDASIVGKIERIVLVSELSSENELAKAA